LTTAADAQTPPPPHTCAKAAATNVKSHVGWTKAADTNVELHTARGVEAVAELCANCTTSPDLLQNLKTVQRTICRTSHARILLFPAQDLIHEAGDDVTDEELIVFCENRAHEYEEYYIKGNPDDRTLQEALLLYGSFYILESLDVKWSDYHLFK
jgi:hypothetical protein